MLIYTIISEVEDICMICLDTCNEYLSCGCACHNKCIVEFVKTKDKHDKCLACDKPFDILDYEYISDWELSKDWPYIIPIMKTITVKSRKESNIHKVKITLKSGKSFVAHISNDFIHH